MEIWENGELEGKMDIWEDGELQRGEDGDLERGRWRFRRMEIQKGEDRDEVEIREVGQRLVGGRDLGKMEIYREGMIEIWEGFRKYSDCGQRVKRGKDVDLGGQRFGQDVFIRDMVVWELFFLVFVFFFIVRL